MDLRYFLYLCSGTLLTHMTKLEGASYIEVSKEFVNKRPMTLLKISDKGRKALLEYRKMMAIFLEDIKDT